MVFEIESFYDLKAYRLGRFYSAVNLAVYFFSFGEIYIDSAQSKMRNKFEYIAKKDRPEYCLLTHYHEDHSGNASLLKHKFNTKIGCSKKSFKYLMNSFEMLPYEKIIWGSIEPFNPDFAYSDAVEIGKLKFSIINTPGHSEDSVCLLEKERGWLFTGDLYISSKPKYLRRDENIYEILESLRALVRFDFDVMFCAHKGILKKSPRNLIKSKIEYLEELIFKVKFLNNKGVNVKKIRDMLLGREDLVSFLTFFDFCKLNLINSILENV